MKEYGRIYRQLLWLQRSFRKLVHRQAQQNGIQPEQMKVLLAIEQNPGCTQKQMAQWLQVPPASLTNVVRRMQRLGWIKRVLDPKDRLGIHFSLTETGAQESARCKEILGQVERQMLSDFRRDEYVDLMDYISRMDENLESPTWECKPKLRLIKSSPRKEEPKKAAPEK